LTPSAVAGARHKRVPRVQGRGHQGQCHPAVRARQGQRGPAVGTAQLALCAAVCRTPLCTPHAAHGSASSSLGRAVAHADARVFARRKRHVAEDIPARPSAQRPAPPPRAANAEGNRWQFDNTNFTFSAGAQRHCLPARAMGRWCERRRLWILPVPLWPPPGACAARAPMRWVDARGRCSRAVHRRASLRAPGCAANGRLPRRRAGRHGPTDPAVVPGAPALCAHARAPPAAAVPNVWGGFGRLPAVQMLGAFVVLCLILF
jgi:hypothetical protein